MDPERTCSSEEEEEEDEDSRAHGYILGCLADPSVPRPAAVASLLTVAIACVAMYFGAGAADKLLSAPSTVSYEAPPDSPSVVASLEVWKTFPVVAMASVSQVVMAISAGEGQNTVLTENVSTFCETVLEKAVTDSRTAMLKPSVTGYYVGNGQLGLGPRDPALREGLVSSDTRMTLLLFVAEEDPKNVNMEGWKVRDNVVEFLQDMASSAPPGVKILLTGNPVTDHESPRDHSIEALLHAEMCTIPVAGVILGVLVRRLRLLIIPLLVLITTFLVACLCVWPVYLATSRFSTDIPPAMISVTIALSLDYSLFFLIRFNENAKLGMRLWQNIKVMVLNVSGTVSISGLLIAVAFFGALTIPEKNLQMGGICLGITTLACLTVNAVLTPSLLLLFGRLLTSPSRCSGASARDAIESEANDDSLLADYQQDGEAVSGKILIPVSPSERMWLNFMQRIQKCPLGAVTMVLLIFSPVMLMLPNLYTSGDAYALLPGTLPSIAAMREIEEAGFAVGRFEPFLILFKYREPQTLAISEMLPQQNCAMLSPLAFDAMLNVSDQINRMEAVKSLLGPTYLMTQRIDRPKAIEILSVADPSAMQTRTIYETLLSLQTTEQAAVLQVHTSFPSRGMFAGRFIEEVRKLLIEFGREHPTLIAEISGGGAAGVDIRNTVMAAMPRYLGTTVLGVTLLVVVMFRSLLLPLRLAFALLFTVAATFGVAIIVYQTSLLHPFLPSLGHFYGLCYSSVPISTCIAIALGLDYDVFLISRIVEYRQSGFSDADSIAYGVAKTGAIISGAGVIMALAFSGLLFATKEMLQQFAMILITSVLLDAFVVRTVLVPALMFSAGSWNWWPRLMPEVSVYPEAVSADTLMLGGEQSCKGEEDEEDTA